MLLRRSFKIILRLYIYAVIFMRIEKEVTYVRNIREGGYLFFVLFCLLFFSFLFQSAIRLNVRGVPLLL